MRKLRWTDGNFSVVMMHPQDFSKDTDTNIVDLESIDKLKALISLCLDAGYELMTFSELANDSDLHTIKLEFVESN